MGPGAVLSMLQPEHPLIALLESHNALKTGRHCALLTNTVGENACILKATTEQSTMQGKRLQPCPDPRASFLYASPGGGATCGSPLADVC